MITRRIFVLLIIHIGFVMVHLEKIESEENADDVEDDVSGSYVHSSSETKLNMSEEKDLEKYLSGFLPSEITESWCPDKCEEEGKVYENPNLSSYCTCEKTEGDLKIVRHNCSRNEIYNSTTSSCQELDGSGFPICVIQNKQCLNDEIGVRSHPSENLYKNYIVCLNDKVIIAQCNVMMHYNETEKRCVHDSVKETILSYSDCEKAPKIDCKKPQVTSIEEYLKHHGNFSEIPDECQNCYYICSDRDDISFDLTIECYDEPTTQEMSSESTTWTYATGFTNYTVSPTSKEINSFRTPTTLDLLTDQVYLSTQMTSVTEQALEIDYSSVLSSLGSYLTTVSILEPTTAKTTIDAEDNSIPTLLETGLLTTIKIDESDATVPLDYTVTEQTTGSEKNDLSKETIKESKGSKTTTSFSYSQTEEPSTRDTPSYERSSTLTGQMMGSLAVEETTVSIETGNSQATYKVDLTKDTIKDVVSTTEAMDRRTSSIVTGQETESISAKETTAERITDKISEINEALPKETIKDLPMSTTGFQSSDSETEQSTLEDTVLPDDIISIEETTVITHTDTSQETDNTDFMKQTTQEHEIATSFPSIYSDTEKPVTGTTALIDNGSKATEQMTGSVSVEETTVATRTDVADLIKETIKDLEITTSVFASTYYKTKGLKTDSTTIPQESGSTEIGYTIGSVLAEETTSDKLMGKTQETEMINEKKETIMRTTTSAMPFSSSHTEESPTDMSTYETSSEATEQRTASFPKDGTTVNNEEDLTKETIKDTTIRTKDLSILVSITEQGAISVVTEQVTESISEEETTTETVTGQISETNEAALPRETIKNIWMSTTGIQSTDSETEQSTPEETVPPDNIFAVTDETFGSILVEETTISKIIEESHKTETIHSIEGNINELKTSTALPLSYSQTKDLTTGSTVTNKVYSKGDEQTTESLSPERTTVGAVSGPEIVDADVSKETTQEHEIPTGSPSIYFDTKDHLTEVTVLSEDGSKATEQTIRTISIAETTMETGTYKTPGTDDLDLRKGTVIDSETRTTDLERIYDETKGPTTRITMSQESGSTVTGQTIASASVQETSASKITKKTQEIEINDITKKSVTESEMATTAFPFGYYQTEETTSDVSKKTKDAISDITVLSEGDSKATEQITRIVSIDETTTATRTYKTSGTDNPDLKKERTGSISIEETTVITRTDTTQEIDSTDLIKETTQEDEIPTGSPSIYSETEEPVTETPALNENGSKATEQITGSVSVEGTTIATKTDIADLIKDTIKDLEISTSAFATTYYKTKGPTTGGTTKSQENGSAEIGLMTGSVPVEETTPGTLMEETQRTEITNVKKYTIKETTTSMPFSSSHTEESPIDMSTYETSSEATEQLVVTEQTTQSISAEEATTEAVTDKISEINEDSLPKETIEDFWIPTTGFPSTDSKTEQSTPDDMIPPDDIFAVTDESTGSSLVEETTREIDNTDLMRQTTQEHEISTGSPSIYSETEEPVTGTTALNENGSKATQQMTGSISEEETTVATRTDVADLIKETIKDLEIPTTVFASTYYKTKEPTIGGTTIPQESSSTEIGQTIGSVLVEETTPDKLMGKTQGTEIIHEKEQTIKQTTTSAMPFSSSHTEESPIDMSTYETSSEATEQRTATFQKEGTTVSIEEDLTKETINATMRTKDLSNIVSVTEQGTTSVVTAQLTENISEETNEASSPKETIKDIWMSTTGFESTDSEMKQSTPEDTVPPDNIFAMTNETTESNLVEATTTSKITEESHKTETTHLIENDMDDLGTSTTALPLSYSQTKELSTGSTMETGTYKTPGTDDLDLRKGTVDSETSTTDFESIYDDTKGPTTRITTSQKSDSIVTGQTIVSAPVQETSASQTTEKIQEIEITDITKKSVTETEMATTASPFGYNQTEETPSDVSKKTKDSIRDVTVLNEDDSKATEQITKIVSIEETTTATRTYQTPGTDDPDLIKEKTGGISIEETTVITRTDTTHEADNTDLMKQSTQEHKIPTSFPSIYSDTEIPITGTTALIENDSKATEQLTGSVSVEETTVTTRTDVVDLIKETIKDLEIPTSVFASTYYKTQEPTTGGTTKSQESGSAEIGQTTGSVLVEETIPEKLIEETQITEITNAKKETIKETTTSAMQFSSSHTDESPIDMSTYETNSEATEQRTASFPEEGTTVSIDEDFTKETIKDATMRTKGFSNIVSVTDQWTISVVTGQATESISEEETTTDTVTEADLPKETIKDIWISTTRIQSTDSETEQSTPEDTVRPDNIFAMTDETTGSILVEETTTGKITEESHKTETTHLIENDMNELEMSTTASALSYSQTEDLPTGSTVTNKLYSKGDELTTSLSPERTTVDAASIPETVDANVSKEITQKPKIPTGSPSIYFDTKDSMSEVMVLSEDGSKATEQTTRTISIAETTMETGTYKTPGTDDLDFRKGTVIDSETPTTDFKNIYDETTTRITISQGSGSTVTEQIIASASVQETSASNTTEKIQEIEITDEITESEIVTTALPFGYHQTEETPSDVSKETKDSIRDVTVLSEDDSKATEQITKIVSIEETTTATRTYQTPGKDNPDLIKEKTGGISIEETTVITRTDTTQEADNTDLMKQSTQEHEIPSSFPSIYSDTEIPVTGTTALIDNGSKAIEQMTGSVLVEETTVATRTDDVDLIKTTIKDLETPTSVFASTYYKTRGPTTGTAASEESNSAEIRQTTGSVLVEEITPEKLIEETQRIEITNAKKETIKETTTSAMQFSSSHTEESPIDMSTYETSSEATKQRTISIPKEGTTVNIDDDFMKETIKDAGMQTTGFSNIVSVTEEGITSVVSGQATESISEEQTTTERVTDTISETNEADLPKDTIKDIWMSTTDFQSTDSETEQSAPEDTVPPDDIFAVTEKTTGSSLVEETTTSKTTEESYKTEETHFIKNDMQELDSSTKALPLSYLQTEDLPTRSTVTNKIDSKETGQTTESLSPEKTSVSEVSEIVDADIFKKTTQESEILTAFPTIYLETKDPITEVTALSEDSSKATDQTTRKVSKEETTTATGLYKTPGTDDLDSTKDTVIDPEKPTTDLASIYYETTTASIFAEETSASRTTENSQEIEEATVITRTDTTQEPSDADLVKETIQAHEILTSFKSIYSETEKPVTATTVTVTETGDADLIKSTIKNLEMSTSVFASTHYKTKEPTTVSQESDSAVSGQTTSSGLAEETTAGQLTQKTQGTEIIDVTKDTIKETATSTMPFSYSHMEEPPIVTSMYETNSEAMEQTTTVNIDLTKDTIKEANMGTTDFSNIVSVTEATKQQTISVITGQATESNSVEETTLETATSDLSEVTIKELGTSTGFEIFQHSETEQPTPKDTVPGYISVLTEQTTESILVEDTITSKTMEETHRTEIIDFGENNMKKLETVTTDLPSTYSQTEDQTQGTGITELTEKAIKKLETTTTVLQFQTEEPLIRGISLYDTDLPKKTTQTLEIPTSSIYSGTKEPITEASAFIENDFADQITESISIKETTVETGTDKTPTTDETKTMENTFKNSMPTTSFTNIYSETTEPTTGSTIPPVSTYVVTKPTTEILVEETTAGKMDETHITKDEPPTGGTISNGIDFKATESTTKHILVEKTTLGAVTHSVIEKTDLTTDTNTRKATVFPPGTIVDTTKEETEEIGTMEVDTHLPFSHFQTQPSTEESDETGLIEKTTIKTETDKTTETDTIPPISISTVTRQKIEHFLEKETTASQTTDETPEIETIELTTHTIKELGLPATFIYSQTEEPSTGVTASDEITTETGTDKTPGIYALTKETVIDPGMLTTDLSSIYSKDEDSRIGEEGTGSTSKEDTTVSIDKEAELTTVFPSKYSKTEESVTSDTEHSERDPTLLLQTTPTSDETETSSLSSIRLTTTSTSAMPMKPLCPVTSLQGLQCTKEGCYRYNNSCTLYYECYYSESCGRIISSEIKECPKCLKFNAKRNTCDIAENVPECTYYRQSHPSHLKKKRQSQNKTCTGPGKFVVPENRARYYDCIYKPKNNEYLLTIKRCPRNEEFDDVMKECKKKIRCGKEMGCTRFHNVASECDKNRYAYDRYDCQKFYHCHHGVPTVPLFCPAEYVFNGKYCQSEKHSFIDYCNSISKSINNYNVVIVSTNSNKN